MGFGLHLGSHLGFGKVANETNSVQNRTVGAMDLQAMPAFRYDAFMLGLMMEYRLLGQLDKPINVGYTDLSGSEFLYGPGLAAHFSSLKLLVAYVLSSSYTVSNPGTSIHEQAYSSGEGIEAILGMEIAASWYFDFIFSQLSYSKVTSDSIESDISANKLSHWNFGFGVSYSY